MLSTYSPTDTDPTLAQDYTVACWRGGWIVYAGAERRWPVAHGFTSSEAAEAWIAEQRAASAG